MDRKKLRISIVSMSPAIIRRIRLKGIPLAPLVLKAYADKRLSEESSRPVDINVKTFFIEETTPQKIAQEILADAPHVVAFSVYIWNFTETMKSARLIKNANSKIIIICGGPQVSPIAMKVMAENAYIDIIPYLTGPGEIVFYKLVKAIIEEKKLDIVENIVYRLPSGSLVKTTPTDEILDYKSTPSPYLNNFPVLNSGEFYTVVLEGAIGCPYDCGYCRYGRGFRKIHYQPLEKILREIDTVYSHPNIKHVIFADSDMLLNHSRAEIIIRHILNQNKNVTTEFDIKVERLNENFAKLIDELPYHRFNFAVQTTNLQALAIIGRLRPSRNISFKKIEAFKQWVSGAEFHIDVMLGLPGDDLSGFKKTLDDCLSVEPTRIGLNYPIYLLPGTRFYEQKDNLCLRYTPAPLHAIIDTDSFPQGDIESALRLVLWLEVLTYYYPAIASYFFSICAGKAPGTWIATLEKWIGAIQKELDLFSQFPSIVNIAVSNIHEWNKLKGELLRRASEAKNAYIIYNTLQDLEGKVYNVSKMKSILIGINVFSYMCSNDISSVEFSNYELLPKNITKDLNKNEICNLFSRYKQ